MFGDYAMAVVLTMPPSAAAASKNLRMIPSSGLNVSWNSNALGMFPNLGGRYAQDERVALPNDAARVVPTIVSPCFRCHPQNAWPPSRAQPQAPSRGPAAVIGMQLRNRTHSFIDVVWNT
jgi:hypothetical protein